MRTRLKTLKMPLSEAEARKQIKYMEDFIIQEAEEIIEVIDAKGEEEFNMEKRRLIEQQKLKVKEFYNRKEKKFEQQQKIVSSNMYSKARLQVLKARADHVSNVIFNAELQLASISQDQQVYPQILEGLIAEGLCVLMEANVTVRCRQADIELVQAAIPQAVTSVKNKMPKIACKVILENKRFLLDDSAGGVHLFAQRGRINVNNTLEARLMMVSRQKLPEIRNTLFGVNENRKFKH